MRFASILVSMAIFAFAMAALSFAGTAHAEPPPIEAEVNDNSPYLGQQIDYVLRFYQGPGLPELTGQLSFEPPGFAGFWNSQNTEQREYTETIDSTEYRVIELRTTLFPNIVGELTIEPAALVSPPDGTGASTRLESAPLTVMVRPLPPGAPGNFTGAVGNFDITAAVDSETGILNQLVLLSVTVSGEGNIEALPEPTWPEFNGWRVFESQSDFESHLVAGSLTGRRVYEISLIPEVVGDLVVQEIWYTHFDPDLEEYVQVATSPVSVSVVAAGSAPELPEVPKVEGYEEETPEMRPIKPVPNSFRQGRSELTDSFAFWAVWSFPLLAVLGAVAWRRRIAAREANRAENLRRGALSNAKAGLGRAVSSGDNHRLAAARAVLSYLSARLDIHANMLTRQELMLRLLETGVPDDMGRRVEMVLAAGDEAGYKPVDDSDGDARDLVSEAGQLLDELEEVFNA